MKSISMLLAENRSNPKKAKTKESVNLYLSSLKSVLLCPAFST